MNKQKIKNILLITIGASFLAAGVVFFLYPAKIITGGTPGLGLLAHYLTDISIGKAMLVINIPLLILGKKYLKTGFVIRTVYAMIVTSIRELVLNIDKDALMIVMKASEMVGSSRRYQ